VPLLPADGGLAGAPLPTQSHAQGGQDVPGAHVGQAQVHVPLSTQPASTEGPGPGPQSHAQGGQVSPGAQAGHAHVQVPPPPPLEQSHAMGGHGAFAGQ
jgi:hypothetical protein